MEVHFYLPEKYWPDSSRQEAWKEGKIVPLEQAGKGASAQAWIYQTWLSLSKAGVQARLTKEIPSAGILITLTGFFSDQQIFPEEVFFAGVVADGLPHPAAHVHLVQNAAHARRLRHGIFIPHWPQPNLLRRRHDRGETFETVRFYGDLSNLAEELRDDKRFEEMGLHFSAIGSDAWHDYRETDCVVAVRGFGKAAYLHKPATKLYNAWLAGVPFVGGAESAYAEDGTEGTDFLCARSVDDFFARMRQLKEDPALRHCLVEAGDRAARKYSAEATVSRWAELVQKKLPALAERWHRAGKGEKTYRRLRERVAVWIDRKIRS